MKLTVAQANLELMICLLQVPECWGYRCSPPHPLKEVSCQAGTWGKLWERAIMCYKRQKQTHWSVDHKPLNRGDQRRTHRKVPGGGVALYVSTTLRQWLMNVTRKVFQTQLRSNPDATQPNQPREEQFQPRYLPFRCYVA